MLNLLVDYKADQWRVFLFPRGAHRPRQFFADGNDQLLLSPASVDLGSLLITPREVDFYKLEAELIRDVFEQVSMRSDRWEQLLKELKRLHGERRGNTESLLRILRVALCYIFFVFYTESLSDSSFVKIRLNFSYDRTNHKSRRALCPGN